MLQSLHDISWFYIYEGTLETQAEEGAGTSMAKKIVEKLELSKKATTKGETSTSVQQLTNANNVVAKNESKSHADKKPMDNADNKPRPMKNNTLETIQTAQSIKTNRSQLFKDTKVGTGRL